MHNFLAIINTHFIVRLIIELVSMMSDKKRRGQLSLFFRLLLVHVRDFVVIISMVLNDGVVAALESEPGVAKFFPGVLLVGLVNCSNQSALVAATSNFVLQRLNRCKKAKSLMLVSGELGGWFTSFKFKVEAATAACHSPSSALW